MSRMWSGCLGPLCAFAEDELVTVPAAKQRVVLAGLLVNANRMMPVDQLAEIVWDGAPPQGVGATVRNYIKRLRQRLGPEAGTRIVTGDHGYLIRAADDELDVLRLASLCRAGSAAAAAGARAGASPGPRGAV